MRFIRVIWCTLTAGHVWIESRRRPGFHTCLKCRQRRSEEWMAAHPDAVRFR